VWQLLFVWCAWVIQLVVPGGFNVSSEAILFGVGFLSVLICWSLFFRWGGFRGFVFPGVYLIPLGLIRAFFSASGTRVGCYGGLPGI